MQTTKRVVLPIHFRTAKQVPNNLKSFFSLCLIIAVFPVLSKAQITFSSPGLPTNMEFTGSGVASVQVGDLNGDGYADIIYNSAPGGGITYLQNNAGNSFSTPAVNPFANFASATPAGVILTTANLADFDGDGDLDFWAPVANGPLNDLYLRNDGSVFTSVTIPGMEFTGAGAGAVKVADINKDGYPDIIYNSGAGSGITYLQNNAGLSFSTPAGNPFVNFTASSPANTVFNSSCDIADYDGDGDPDVWVRVAASADVYLRNDAGIYVSGTVPPGMDFTAAGLGAVEVADFNGDGLVDILFMTATGGAINYWQNNLGSFSTPNPNPFAGYSTGTPTGTIAGNNMTVADFDGDGDLDIWGRNASTAADFYAINTSTPPGLISSTPARNAINVVRSTNITMVFSKPVFTGSGSFHIRRVSDNSILETIAATGSQVTGSGTTTIVIDPQATLSSTTPYYLTFTRTALADALGIIPGSLDVNARMPASSPDFLSFTTSAALPVTFGNLAAVIHNGVLSIDFTTLAESSNDHFDIEASTDGESFAVIGTINSKAEKGNSSIAISYSFIKDIPGSLLNISFMILLLSTLQLKSRRKRLPSSISLIILIAFAFTGCNKQNKDLVNTKDKIYIRIAQVDKDGSKSYSKIITATRE
ncbi:FG-GAP-like repeat-containing protein [Niabella sp. CJ426]|uniref:FG-GAP-like repeat-containing protein n=1 Tax=Niabella sp. CJ426 TaxID=3393740 RepID=UPI003CFF1F7A